MKIKIALSIVFLIIFSCKEKPNDSKINDSKNDSSLVENKNVININNYKFFSYIDESDNIVAENSSDKEFNLLIIISSQKEEIYGKIKMEDATPSDILNDYKDITLKLLTLKNFTFLKNVEGGTVCKPKYPCSLILNDIDPISMLKTNPNKKIINTQKELIDLINSNTLVTNKTSLTTFKTPKGLYELKKEKILLENEYNIIALENDSVTGEGHFSNPIVVLQKTNDGFIKIKENDNLVFGYDDNCPTDGFINIVSKRFFFTIEQIFCADFNFIRSYTTFKIEGKNSKISLYKYSQEYTDRSNPNKTIQDKIWTTKDFGEVKFEDVSQRFIINLIQNEPKK